MRLEPLGDRVVLKQLVAEETTKSGIVLPGQSKEKPQQDQFSQGTAISCRGRSSRTGRNGGR